MITYGLESPGLRRLQANVRKYPALSKSHFGKAIVAATVEVHRQAIRGVVPWDTGMLTKTMAYSAVASRLTGRVFPTRDYAIYVHEGTSPHTITPRTKKALFWSGASHPVRSVKHPGNKPNRFLPRMLDLALPSIEKHFEKAGDRINQAIANI